MGMILRKLSPDVILGEDRKRPDKAEFYYRIAGKAVSFETGQTQYGEYVALIGDFKAVRFDTGEVFTATECFLPCGIGELIAAKLKAASEGTCIEFVYDVGLKPAPIRKPEDAVKYEYILANPADNDSTNAMVKMMQELPPPRVVKSLPSGG